MDRTERVELTNLCMCCRGDEILLQNRQSRDWAGWTFPGGHVEPGESFVDSVIREMKEETGLEIRNPVLCGLKQFPKDGARYLVFLFRAEEFDGELVSSPEGEMRWFRRDEIPYEEAVPDFRELLPVMELPSLTEFQYVVEEGQWKIVLK